MVGFAVLCCAAFCQVHWVLGGVIWWLVGLLVFVFAVDFVYFHDFVCFV